MPAVADRRASAAPNVDRFHTSFQLWLMLGDGADTSAGNGAGMPRWSAPAMTS
jgi:hypothetical protein